MGSDSATKVQKKKKLKSPSELRTEKLMKMFDTNQPGQLINNREIKKPFDGHTKKLKVNHFKSRNNSMQGAEVGSQSLLDFENEAEKFDHTGAANIMNSKYT